MAGNSLSGLFGKNRGFDARFMHWNAVGQPGFGWLAATPFGTTKSTVHRSPDDY
jgi:hypothetical protein